MNRRITRPMITIIACACIALLTIAATRHTGRAEARTEPKLASHQVTVSDEAPRLIEQHNRAAAIRTYAEGVAIGAWLDGIARAEAEAQAQREADELARRDAEQRESKQRSASNAPRAAAQSDGSAACGGSLPPCSVKNRESRGNYGAVNPNGCGGGGCYGAWQFDQRTWDAAARRSGRDDLVGARANEVDPGSQDQLAAELWAGGSGCGHWAAC